jgi:thymidylate kinase
VTLAGPDGAGKSTLADELGATALGAFRRVSRLHLGPGLLPAPGRLLRRRARDRALPHEARPSGLAGSAARVAYLFADTRLGWSVRVTWPRLRSGLVLLERGWWDLAVDPRRYRLASPAWLTRALGRLGPRPDLVLVLDAPAAAIRRRKAELPTDEVERQRRAWQALAAGDPRRYRTVDTGRTASEALADALELIDEALVERQLRLDGSALALRCLGRVRRGGRPYAIVAPGRRPRWVLPTGSAGPVAWGLYRPTSARRVAAAIAVEGACRLPGGPGRRIELDVRAGVGPALAEALGCDAVELAAAIPRDAHRAGRVALAVRSRGRLAAFAKVEAADPARLRHELALLEALAACDLERLVVPRVLACFEWEGCAVLALEPLRTSFRSQPDAGEPEVEALAELGRLGDALRPVLGASEGRIPVHGDFAPWNASRQRTGGLVLWDWEEARLGLPLEDLFTWRARALLHLGHGTPEGLVAGAQRPDAHVETLASALGISTAAAPRALEAALARVAADAGARAETWAIVDRARDALGGGA